MAIDHVKIPQDIHIEDKIIGPLSLRQIGLVAGGGGVSYAFFAFTQKALGFVPIYAHLVIWLPLLICGAYALVKINNLSLFRLTLLVIESMMKPRERPWLPRRGISLLGAPAEKKKTKEEEKDKKNDAEEKKPPSIGDLAGILDNSGSVKTEHRDTFTISSAARELTVASPSS